MRTNSDEVTTTTQRADEMLLHERKSRFVVMLTAVTMIAEIAAGYATNSMALLADGYHMSSHVLALGLTWTAYIVARKFQRTRTSSFSRERLLALSGFSSAILLQIVAIGMAVQSFGRLITPLPIRYEEAIIVAVIGLGVNIASALALRHDEAHGDHNMRAAYLHVLADALTSVTAIVALSAGYFYRLDFLDALSGLLSAVIITKWAIDLIIHTGKELVDFKRHE